ncbi:hypothetical protein [Antarctobacter jejuensis]|uniref:hypothetical protein n=1 Tax=Antarctobacter jejuensis TaxID=1439938 RepID=UPI003FD476F5
MAASDVTGPEVAAVLAQWPEAARGQAEALFELIHAEAAAQQVDPLSVSLKWGQPSLTPEAARTGTPIRLHWVAKVPEHLQVLVHCQTSLVETWRDAVPGLTYDGNRAILLPLGRPLPVDDLRRCFAQALTYHRSGI